MKKIPRAYWVIVASVVLVCALLAGLSNYRYRKLQNAVVDFKYGMAAAQNQQQAEAVAVRFDQATSGGGASSQASAGLFGWIKHIFGGKSKSYNPGGPDTSGWNPETEEFDSPSPAGPEQLNPGFEVDKGLQ